MTQADVAEAVGMSNQSISRYELGVRDMKVAALARICAATGTTMFEMFTRAMAAEPETFNGQYVPATAEATVEEDVSREEHERKPRPGPRSPRRSRSGRPR